MDRPRDFSVVGDRFASWRDFDIDPAIAAGLGGAPADAIDDAHFDQWLAQRPIAELPGYVQLSVPALGDLFERLRAVQPFIVWRLRGR